MKQITEDYIKEVMNRVGTGERIIAVAVPTRAFRVVVADAEETTFRVEQLVRQAGDKWVPLATCHDIIPWRAYVREALPNMEQSQQRFALEMRKIKVERNRLARDKKALETIRV